MSERETSQQGSFEVDPESGAFVVPEAPDSDTAEQLPPRVVRKPFAYSSLLGRPVSLENVDEDIREQEALLRQRLEKLAEQGVVFPSEEEQDLINRMGAADARQELAAAQERGRAANEARRRAALPPSVRDLTSPPPPPPSAKRPSADQFEVRPDEELVDA